MQRRWRIRKIRHVYSKTSVQFYLDGGTVVLHDTVGFRTGIDIDSVVLLHEHNPKFTVIEHTRKLPLTVVDHWLQDFAYRIEIGWSIFVLAGLVSLSIALLTVSYQTIKTSLSNPVDALKYE